MGINLTNMVPVNGYKFDKYGWGQWIILVDKMGIVIDILFETNTSENHEYMFLKNWWI